MPIFSGNKLFRAFWGILPLFSEFFSQKLFLPFEKWKLTSRKFRRNIPSYLSIFPNLKIEHHFRKPKNLTKIFLFFSPSKNNTNFFSFFSLFFSFVLHHTASLFVFDKIQNLSNFSANFGQILLDGKIKAIFKMRWKIDSELFIQYNSKKSH